MMRGKLFSTLLFAAAIAATPNVAQALTLNVTSGSVGLAQLCAGTDPLCASPVLPFVDGGALSGTITLEAGNVSFDITASVIGFDDTTDTLELQSVNYVAAAVAIVGTPADFTASGNATVTGSVSENGGLATALNIAAAPYTLTCEDESGQLKCGIVLVGFPIFGLQYDGTTHYVPHTLNPTAVPEPQTFVMALTAGLLGLAYGRPKATS